jgi:large subunit ribosomal protein L23
MAKKTAPTEKKEMTLADRIIIQPHVTERATKLASQEAHPVYTFLVAASANKAEVKAAVRERYGVTPLRVNVINVRPKTIMHRGRPGRRPGARKALVLLKKGDKIDFV